VTAFRAAVIVAVMALALALTSAGLLAWVIADPQYWFPDAYEEKGERGDRGPRGPVGPAGPPGPVGPDASDAIAELADSASVLESDVADLQAEVESGDLTGRVDDVETSLQDVADKVDAICSEFSLYDGALADIYIAAC
jgi:hypothetical protein